MDGMGPAGVEGPMRRCCEEALTVMRAARESLLTVIEVFIHDPLINWKMTAEQAQRRQKNGQKDNNNNKEDEDGDEMKMKMKMMMMKRMRMKKKKVWAI